MSLGEFSTLSKEERDQFYRERICVPTPTEHANYIDRVQFLQVYNALEAYTQVLDVGCHDGFATRWLASDDYACEWVLGIDLCKEAITAARDLAKKEKHPNKLEYQLMGWEKFDLFFGEDIKFDAIVAFELLEHFTEEEGRAMLAFVQRHLKPGGRAFVSTPDIDGVWGSVNPEREHIRLYGRDDLARVLTESTGKRQEITLTAAGLFLGTWVNE